MGICCCYYYYYKEKIVEVKIGTVFRKCTIKSCILHHPHWGHSATEFTFSLVSPYICKLRTLATQTGSWRSVGSVWHDVWCIVGAHCMFSLFHFPLGLNSWFRTSHLYSEPLSLLTPISWCVTGGHRGRLQTPGSPLCRQNASVWATREALSSGLLSIFPHQSWHPWCSTGTPMEGEWVHADRGKHH